MGQLVRGDAGLVISDHSFDEASRLRCGDDYLSPARRILDGVIKQIAEQLLEPVRCCRLKMALPSPRVLGD